MVACSIQSTCQAPSHMFTSHSKLMFWNLLAWFRFIHLYWFLNPFNFLEIVLLVLWPLSSGTQ